VICVSLLRAPQYSTFACSLIPVLTLVVLLVMLDAINDISFSNRRYFLIVSRMSISVYCIPTRDIHITRDMCMGIHISLWHRNVPFHWTRKITEISNRIFCWMESAPLFPVRPVWILVEWIAPYRHYTLPSQREFGPPVEKHVLISSTCWKRFLHAFISFSHSE